METCDYYGMEWACRELTALASDLSPVEMAIAVNAVVERAEEYAEDRVFDLQHTAADKVGVTPSDYLEAIIAPAHEDGLISDETLAQWRASVETGHARLDPRVKRFCDEANSWITDYFAPFLRARKTLSEHLGVPEEEIGLVSAEWGPVILRHGEMIFKVFAPGQARQVAERHLKTSARSLIEQAKEADAEEDALPSFLRNLGREEETDQKPLPSTRDFFARMAEGDSETLEMMFHADRDWMPVLAYGECRDGMISTLSDGTIILRMLQLEPWLDDLTHG